jgi:hypothetical protein
MFRTPTLLLAVPRGGRILTENNLERDSGARCEVGMNRWLRWAQRALTASVIAAIAVELLWRAAPQWVWGIGFGLAAALMLVRIIRAQRARRGQGP